MSDFVPDRHGVVNAISDWRFEPPTLDHKPVAVCLTVTVRQEVM